MNIAGWTDEPSGHSGPVMVILVVKEHVLVINILVKYVSIPECIIIDLQISFLEG
jgi:hypothetical protein